MSFSSKRIRCIVRTAHVHWRNLVLDGIMNRLRGNGQFWGIYLGMSRHEGAPYTEHGDATYRYQYCSRFFITRHIKHLDFLSTSERNFMNLLRTGLHKLIWYKDVKESVLQYGTSHRSNRTIPTSSTVTHDGPFHSVNGTRRQKFSTWLMSSTYSDADIV